MYERVTVDDGQGEGDWSARLDCDLEGSAGPHGEHRATTQGGGDLPPLADQRAAALIGPGRSMVLAKARIKVDHGIDRAAFSAKPSDQHGGGEQATADVGDPWPRSG
jgi:hypothetical protein